MFFHSPYESLYTSQFTKVVALSALIAGASAFTTSPAFGVGRKSTAVYFEYGEYDEKLWDNDAKKDVYGKWDPSQPRTSKNFNPFETFDGNSPDASGKYPGEKWYKDPIRGDVSFTLMMEERKEAEEREKNPKPGDVPGCPGCRN